MLLSPLITFESEPEERTGGSSIYGIDCEIAHAGTCSQSVCGSGTQVVAGFGELAELAHTWFEVLWVA